MKLSMEKHKSLSNGIKSDVHTCQVHRDVGWWWWSCLEQNGLTCGYHNENPYIPSCNLILNAYNAYLFLFISHHRHHSEKDTCWIKIKQSSPFSLFIAAELKFPCLFYSFHFPFHTFPSDKALDAPKKIKYYAIWREKNMFISLLYGVLYIIHAYTYHTWEKNF